MPISYLLSLSEFQIRFLYWVAAGCPEGETRTWLFAGMQFVKVARKMESLEYVNHRKGDQVVPWTLTAKGNALIKFIKMEVPL